MPDAVEIFTDGACKGNPGPGGWGALLRYGEHERELCGGEPQTTNNRMELMAVIAALETLKRPTTRWRARSDEAGTLATQRLAHRGAQTG